MHGQNHLPGHVLAPETVLLWSFSLALTPAKEEILQQWTKKELSKVPKQAKGPDPEGRRRKAEQEQQC
jgi:hypothetical protein